MKKDLTILNNNNKVLDSIKENTDLTEFRESLIQEYKEENNIESIFHTVALNYKINVTHDVFKSYNYDSNDIIVLFDGDEEKFFAIVEDEKIDLHLSFIIRSIKQKVLSSPNLVRDRLFKICFEDFDCFIISNKRSTAVNYFGRKKILGLKELKSEYLRDKIVNVKTINSRVLFVC